MLEITGRSNERIKYAVRLGESASFRNERNEFFLEGARLCFDAVGTGVHIKTAFFTAEAMKKYPEYVSAVEESAGECFLVSKDVASRLAMTEGAQGVFCICEDGGKRTAEIRTDGRYLALENVQDPANLGAICRTAEALGLDGLIVSGGCDIHNPKALRAAMGSSLRLNIIRVPSLPDFLGEYGKRGMLTLASTPRADAVSVRSVPEADGVICVVGNEGNGVTQETMSACKLLVTIPMAGRAESLNASAAAAILIWELLVKG